MSVVERYLKATKITTLCDEPTHRMRQATKPLNVVVLPEIKTGFAIIGIWVDPY